MRPSPLALATLAVLATASARADGPAPPSPRELADIQAEVDAKAVAASMAYRHALRIGGYLGVVAPLEMDLPAGDCFSLYNGGLLFMSLAAGVRYALTPWLDLQARTGFLGPFRRSDGSGFAWSLDATLRIRPAGSLIPLYVGIGPAFAVASVTSTDCETTATASDSEVSLLVGPMIDSGFDFGSTEQFELGLRLFIDGAPGGRYASLDGLELVFGMVFP